MASNNPQDYIHPIIQAFISNQQLRQQQEQLAETARRNKEQEKIDREQMAQRDKLSKSENDLRLQQLEVEKAAHKFQQKKAGFDALSQAIGKGATPKSVAIPGTFDLSNGMNVQQGIPDPLGGPDYFDPSMFANLEQEIQGAAAKQGALTAAQAQALEPFKRADDERAMQLAAQNKEADFLRLQAGKDEDYLRTQNVEEIRRRNQLERTRLQGQFQLAAAQARLKNPGTISAADESLLSKYQNDLYITGTQKITDLPTKLRPAVIENVPKGWTPLSKTDGVAFDGVKLIEDYIDTSKELVGLTKDFSGKFAAYTGFGPAGDAAAVSKRLTGMAENLGRTIGNMKGVFTDKDIERIQGLTFSNTNTNAQNKQNTVQLEKLLKERLQPLLKKYAPDQAEGILSSRDLDAKKYLDNQEPEWLKLAPSENKRGTKLNKIQSLQEGRPVYGGF